LALASKLDENKSIVEEIKTLLDAPSSSPVRAEETETHGKAGPS